MFEWIAGHTAAFIVIVVLLILVVLAVFSIVRNRKKGSGGCTGNCATCRMGCSGGKKK